jgi:peptidoglycan/LPS O-acetylase OafA/YrhL
MHQYRSDIDGMRAIAVVSVILFHLGFLPNGYLGVDIFFVISGFLITQIIYKETLKGQFTIANFYMRRIRRILPLVMVVCAVALVAGYIFMLPDDLENMAQSVIATNFFANNILLLMTSKNYWNVVNEYKPLMHTWSLGVEEQFYVVFPLIFLFLKGKRTRYILPVIIAMTLASLAMFFLQPRIEPKFYLIQYRFFELAIGGIGAILIRQNTISASIKPFLLFLILFILISGQIFSLQLRILLVTVATLGLLLPSVESPFIKLALSNPVSVYLGKISFSLYMWHQLYLAFGRYFVFEHINYQHALILGVLILATSALSYQLVEQPFRDKKRTTPKMVLAFTALMFLLNVGFAFYLYKINGVVRDVPELGLSKSKTYTGNLNFVYNDRVYQLNKPFDSIQKKNILVVGDSYGRDWANVLLESANSNDYELSYVDWAHKVPDMQNRLDKADVVFVCNSVRAVDSINFQKDPKGNINGLVSRFRIDTAKVYCAGIKNFGSNMGIYYNRGRWDTAAYCRQCTRPDDFVLRMNYVLSDLWGDRYIDLITPVINRQMKVPVYTDDCKFISQDTDHLTEAGAKYYARILQQRITEIVK